MQKSYLCKQAINFGQASNFFIRPGDILKFDSDNQNKLTVYRNGEIQKVLAGQSSGSLASMSKMGWIVEIHGSDVPRTSSTAPKTPVPAAGKPAGSVKAAEGGKSTSVLGKGVQTASKKPIADSTV